VQVYLKTDCLQGKKIIQMADSFTTLWTRDRCRALLHYQREGTSFNTLFGGPHTSEPSFRRAGVQAGDTIYPVRVEKGILYIISRMRVKEILTIDEYIERFPDLFIGCERTPWATITFDNYLKLHPELHFLAPTCTLEVVLGDDSTPICLNRAVPSEVLERLRFRSQRRERSLKQIEDGRITSVIGLQGIYRLSKASADDFARLLQG
jgi:hypothetical protein